MYDGATRTWGTFSAALSTTAFGNADNNRPFDLVFDRAAGAGRMLLAYSDTAGHQVPHVLRQRRQLERGADSRQRPHRLLGADGGRAEPARPPGDRRRQRRPAGLDVGRGGVDVRDADRRSRSTSTDRSTANDPRRRALRPDRLPGRGRGKINYRSIGTAADYTDGNGRRSPPRDRRTVTGSGHGVEDQQPRPRGPDHDRREQLRRPARGHRHAAHPRLAGGRHGHELRLHDRPAVHDAPELGELHLLRRSPAGRSRWRAPTSWTTTAARSGSPTRTASFTWLALANPVLIFDGTTTDPTRSITLTADGVNRHYGVPGAGVVRGQLGEQLLRRHPRPRRPRDDRVAGDPLPGRAVDGHRRGRAARPPTTSSPCGT